MFQREGEEILVCEKVSRCITSFSGLLSMGRVVAAAGYCCGYRYCTRFHRYFQVFSRFRVFGLLSHTALRAPPWAFTVHRGCSHYPHNVSAHALSSPRGIGILAPAPRCDLRAGGRRTRGRTPTHTLATHRVRTRRARGTLAGSSRSSSLCTTSQQPPRLRAGGCRYPRWAAVLRPRLRGHERRVPRGPRPFTTHVTLSHPTYGAAGRRASFGSLPFASLSATSLA